MILRKLFIGSFAFLFAFSPLSVLPTFTSAIIPTVSAAALCTPNEASTQMSDAETQVDGQGAVVITPHPAWASISGSSWIWSEALDPNGSSPAPSTEIFSKTFTITGSPTNSSLEIATDNTYSVSVNGNALDTGTSATDENNFSSTDTWVVPAASLLSGSNTITITVTNTLPPPEYTGANPAGLIYKLTVNSETCPPPGPVFIDSNTNDVFDSGEADYETIQAAVNAANNGDTIKATAGTYLEHVVVNKPVTINGAQSGVDARSRGAVSESIVDGEGSGAAFAINSNDVKINGFTIQNGGGDLNSGIWMGNPDPQNATIVNNIFTSNHFGIWADCGANCLIEYNLFNANNDEGGPGSGSISADSTTGLTIRNNEFKNESAGNPILFQATGAASHNNLTVSANNFHDNVYAAIFALGVSNGTISGNTITTASDSTGITFDGANTNITITGNTFNGGARGVRVRDAGYELGDNSSIVLHNNSFLNQTEYGVGNEGGYADDGIIDATNNWWGNASGPYDNKTLPGSPDYNNPTGTGSPVTTKVDYNPWYTDSEMIFHNTDKATLTIIKRTIGGTGTFDFVLTGNTSTSTQITTGGEDASGSVTLSINAGTTTVSELSKSGWALTDVSCEYDEESIGRDVEGGEEIYVDDGDHVTCTFTNSNKGVIRVVKKVVDIYGNEIEDSIVFGVSVDSTSTSQGIAVGKDTFFTVEPGQHTIYEDLGDKANVYTTQSITTDENEELPDTQVNVTAGATTTVIVTNLKRSESSGGGSPQSPSGGSGTPPPPSNPGSGQVLGESTTTVPTLPPAAPTTPPSTTPPALCNAELIQGFIRFGGNNNRNDVMILQRFLNNHQAAGLPVTGFYGPLTRNQVVKFQVKEAFEILKPWVDLGLLPNLQTGTGYVFKTTQRRINSLLCPNLNLPVPPLP